MLIDFIAEQRIAVSVVGALAGVLYLMRGLRGCDQSLSEAGPGYAVAGAGFATAGLVLLRVVSPVIGYSILCLALVARHLADLLVEEHARRRRVASLSPRPPVPAMPLVWISIAALSTLMLVPYLLADIERAAAIVVGCCALTMAAIALRIAVAPTQFVGDDPLAESIRDGAERASCVGIDCVLAVGIVFVFSSFEGGSLPAPLPLQQTIPLLALCIWLSLWIYVSWYVRRLSRSAGAASR